jgi:hypothetical protein
MPRERTRVPVRSWSGRRRVAACAPGTGPATVGDLVAGDDVGWARRPARQPDVEPGGGPVRRQCLPGPRPASAGPPVRARGSGRPGQRLRLALAGAQPRAGTAATGHQNRRRPAGAARPGADATDEELTGAQGRRQATAFPDEETASSPGGGRLTPRRTPSGGEAEALQGRSEPSVEGGQQLLVLVGPRAPQRCQRGVALRHQRGVLRPGVGQAEIARVREG